MAQSTVPRHLKATALRPHLHLPNQTDLRPLRSLPSLRDRGNRAHSRGIVPHACLDLCCMHIRLQVTVTRGVARPHSLWLSWQSLVIYEWFSAVLGGVPGVRTGRFWPLGSVRGIQRALPGAAPGCRSDIDRPKRAPETPHEIDDPSPLLLNPKSASVIELRDPIMVWGVVWPLGKCG